MLAASLRRGVALLASALVLALAIDLARAQQRPAHQPGQQWPRVSFPDGSGSIALPQGWRITSSFQGSAEIQGPHGEGLAVGITRAIGPAQFAGPAILAGPYLPPPQAYAWVSEIFARQAGGTAQVRIAEVAPTAPLTQNGQTAYLLADQMNRGRHYRSFALVNTAALGTGYWQYYMTLLTAPADIFPQALPLMTEIWQSWSVSQGEMNRRMAHAMLTMRETNRIMQSTAEGRRTTEWHQSLTGMTLQGRWVVEDTQTGQRKELTSQEMNALFQAFPGRYRTLGAAELK